MQYKTKAHTEARKGGYRCASCNRSLKAAKYAGEYCFGYDKQGRERMISVYLVCRCKCINDVSSDITDDDGFMNTVDDVALVPRRATKIVTAPIEETA